MYGNVPIAAVVYASKEPNSNYAGGPSNFSLSFIPGMGVTLTPVYLEGRGVARIYDCCQLQFAMFDRQWNEMSGGSTAWSVAELKQQRHWWAIAGGAIHHLEKHLMMNMGEMERDLFPREIPPPMPLTGTYGQTFVANDLLFVIREPVDRFSQPLINPEVKPGKP